jgi:hypothetical protein
VTHHDRKILLVFGALAFFVLLTVISARIGWLK